MNPNIFREYDIRGIVGQDLNAETVATISRAITAYFLERAAKNIVVGYDARESSPRFHGILASIFQKAGLSVSSIGRVPTPVLYYALFTENADGAVMLTGSHNPSNHNGFKISLGKNSLYGEEIQKIKNLAVANVPDLSLPQLFDFDGDAHENLSSSSQIDKKNVFDSYLNELWRNFSFGERKLKIVVDAGNGMGGVTAVPLYERLGVEVVELFCEPDSAFPNHEPDPSQPENLRDLIEKVVETRADLGIAFDGDADRITVVDETGRIIWGDELMVLFAREVLEETPSATIIAEVKCTQVLFNEIEKLGGKAIMSQAGHSIIKAKMREEKAVLAGEMSGHIFFADRFYGFDDACYAGARLLEILSKTDEKLSEIFRNFPQTVVTPEIRIPCTEEKKAVVLRKIIEEFSQTNEVLTIDGARIKFENGWALVRPSNTQALIILRFEAATENHLRKIRRIVEEKLGELTEN